MLALEVEDLDNADEVPDEHRRGDPVPLGRGRDGAVVGVVDHGVAAPAIHPRR